MSKTLEKEEFMKHFYSECVACKLGEINRPEICMNLSCAFEWEMLEEEL